MSKIDTIMSEIETVMSETSPIMVSFSDHKLVAGHFLVAAPPPQ